MGCDDPIVMARDPTLAACHELSLPHGMTVRRIQPAPCSSITALHNQHWVHRSAFLRVLHTIRSVLSMTPLPLQR